MLYFMIFYCVFRHVSIYCGALPLKWKFTTSNCNVWPLLTPKHWCCFCFVFFIKCSEILFHFWINPLAKPFQYLKSILYSQTLCSCSSETCCFDYLISVKWQRSSFWLNDVICDRKRKWQWLWAWLFTIFLFQMFTNHIAFVYCPKKEKDHKFWQWPKF